MIVGEYFSIPKVVAVEALVKPISVLDTMTVFFPIFPFQKVQLPNCSFVFPSRTLTKYSTSISIASCTKIVSFAKERKESNKNSIVTNFLKFLLI